MLYFSSLRCCKLNFLYKFDSARTFRQITQQCVVQPDSGAQQECPRTLTVCWSKSHGLHKAGGVGGDHHCVKARWLGYTMLATDSIVK
jgi:hypothetical protein